MLLLHITDAEKAFFDEHTGIEWNVIFLLLGMMVIVAVLRQTGVFEYVAIWAAKRARGRPYRLMVMLVLITAFASALLDNVTTVLLIAPVTFLVCERLGLRAAPVSDRRGDGVQHRRRRARWSATRRTSSSPAGAAWRSTTSWSTWRRSSSS